MSAMLEKTSGYSCFNGHNCINFQQILIKLCIYATNSLVLHKMDSLRGMQQLLFLLRVHCTLNTHEICPHLLWGEHILYIRAMMTSFLNIRWLAGVMAWLIK